MSLYPQAPLSIGQVLDRGFSMYRTIFKPMLAMSLTLGVLAELPSFVQHGAMLVNPGSAGAGIVAIITMLVLFVVWFIVYMSLYNGWVIGIDAVARGGQPYSMGQAIAAGRPKIVSMIGGGILFALAFLIGLLLLVIPGIILMGSLIFFGYFVLLENQPAVESLKSSHKLVWGHWWRTVTILTVAGLLYFVAMAVVMMVAAAVFGLSAFDSASPEEARETVTSGVLVFVLVQGVLNGLLMPLFTSISLMTFRDLQLRKSGSDLVARAAAA